jgi:hypothetical protein
MVKIDAAWTIPILRVVSATDIDTLGAIKQNLISEHERYSNNQ